MSDAPSDFTDDFADARPPHDAMPNSHDDSRDDAGTETGASSAARAADEASTDPTQPPEHEVEGAVPPGYDWPTHGGYLGCLVGSIAACLVTGFFGANLFSYLYIARGWPFPLFALLTLVLFAGVVVLLGQLGWRLGRRFYRYYPQPKPTWGEDDAAEAELAHIRPTTPRTSNQRKGIGEPGRESTRALDQDLAHPDEGEVAVDQSDERDTLVEGRESQDDGRDGGGEAADQAENAYQEPQRP